MTHRVKGKVVVTNTLVFDFTGELEGIPNANACEYYAVEKVSEWVEEFLGEDQNKGRILRASGKAGDVFTLRSDGIRVYSYDGTDLEVEEVEDE